MTEAAQPSGKRDWVYTGLLHTPGVVLARSSPATRLQPGATVLLAGDVHAAALLPFVQQLASSASVTVEFVSAIGVDSLRSPARSGMVRPHGDQAVATASQPLGQATANWVPVPRVERGIRLPPAIIAVSMPIASATVADAVILRELNERFRLLGSRLVWLRPPLLPQEIQPLRVLLRAAGIRSFPTETVSIHRAPSGGPSARGYAGWAGAFWRWLV